MSKMDDLRAMREARYAARGTAPAARAAPAAKRTPRVTPAAVAPPAAEPKPDEAGRCGHRAISGRTCTREHGHAAKSHRYS